MELKIGDQSVLIKDNRVHITINSLFRSAGILYGFKNKSPGISISQEILRFAVAKGLDLAITIKPSTKVYKISTVDYLNTVHEYKSVYTTTNKYPLYVFPINEL
jgi:hypothetical protein